MPWVVDGNNLAGGRRRGAVRQAALDLARRERVRILVFFDGAPPVGVPSVERLGQVEVRYVPDADEAIVGHLAGAGAGWRVATDDRALSRRVRDAGAEAVASEAFWGRAPGPREQRGEGEARLDPDAEAAYFRDPVNRLSSEPTRVARRRRRRS